VAGPARRSSLTGGKKAKKRRRVIKGNAGERQTIQEVTDGFKGAKGRIGVRNSFLGIRRQHRVKKVHSLQHEKGTIGGGASIEAKKKWQKLLKMIFELHRGG